MTKEEVERIMKVVFFTQFTIECIDEVHGDYPWKHLLKQKGNHFLEYAENFVDGVLRNVNQEEQDNYNAILIELRKAVENVYNEITVNQ